MRPPLHRARRLDPTLEPGPASARAAARRPGGSRPRSSAPPARCSDAATGRGEQATNDPSSAVILASAAGQPRRGVAVPPTTPATPANPDVASEPMTDDAEPPADGLLAPPPAHPAATPASPPRRLSRRPRTARPPPSRSLAAEGQTGEPDAETADLSTTPAALAAATPAIQSRPRSRRKGVRHVADSSAGSLDQLPRPAPAWRRRSTPASRQRSPRWPRQVVQTGVALAASASPAIVGQIVDQVIKNVQGKSTRFDIALQPAGLGQVNVKIEINTAGQVSAVMSFDNPHAAAEARAHAGDLQQALEQAGFNLSQGGLSFDVGGQGASLARREPGPGVPGRERIELRPPARRRGHDPHASFTADPRHVRREHFDLRPRDDHHAPDQHHDQQRGRARSTMAWRRSRTITRPSCRS